MTLKGTTAGGPYSGHKRRPMQQGKEPHMKGSSDTGPLWGEIDDLVKKAGFTLEEQVKERSRRTIRQTAQSRGAYPASIQGLYSAAGRGLYTGRTVPAINIRGITYHVPRAGFRAALEHRVGAFIFEIARSEVGYTKQSPAEYAACILAAAVRESFKGPVFIQGDHFQVNGR